MPVPLRPMTAIRSPASTWKAISSSSGRWPKATETRSSATSGMESSSVHQANRLTGQQADRHLIFFDVMNLTSRGLLIAALVVSSSRNHWSAAATNAAIEAETIQHFQALLRIDTSSPPGNETTSRRIPEVGLREGRHSLPGVRQGSLARQHRRAHQGQRQEAPDPDPRPHRRRHDRSDQVDASAIRRGARRRLRLRPRHR